MQSAARLGEKQLEALHFDATSSYCQRADIADPVFETDFQRPDIRHQPPAAIRQGHFLFVLLIQLKLEADVFGNAKMNRARISQRLDLHRLKRRVSCVSQCNARIHKTH